jgi:enoyl-CoA hydratase
MSTNALTVERRGPVAVLTVDDGKANALTTDLMAALGAAVDDADADPDVRAVVLAGREGRFCAGFDLGVMSGGDPTAVVTLVADGGDLVAKLYGSGVPVVAACTGHALAAGALLLLGCDMRFGADVPAKIGLNEVAIRLSLPDWALTIAQERLSRRHLQRAVANARITTPAEAVDVGFLDAVVPAGELLDRAVAHATELAETLDRAAYRRTVHALRAHTLVKMAAQVTADREAVKFPTS